MDRIIVIFILSFVALTIFGIIWRSTKGKRGEKRVATLLSRLPNDRYRVINDLLIKNGNYSTQIDHVVVSVYGIFVIETKHYKGWIYGWPDSEYWTQNIYGNKYQLRNPLLQNQAHRKAIARLLKEYGPIPIYCIVAFSYQADLNVNRTLPVMYWRDVVPYIKRFDQPQITDALANDIYNKLMAANVPDKEARKQHVQNVRRNQSRSDIAVANGKCPRCGGNLVLRNGKYGRFYGCSNYPKCKYTHN